MADYGIEVRDAGGTIILNNELLTHRLWHHGVYGTNASVTFDEPLNHRPTVVSLGINGIGAFVQLETNNGLYSGMTVVTAGSESLVLVFARE